MTESLKILMVEDVAADAELALRELKRGGLACVAHRVEEEDEFRRELAEFRPHVVLSDFSMPHFDGMQALAIVRESHPDVPFIFLSGTIGEEYAIRALQNGATDYVLKNNLVRLPPAVERAIEDAKAHAAKRRAEQELRESEARFRSLTELSSDWYWEQDRDFRFTKLVGHSAIAIDQIVGKTRWEVGTLALSDAALNAHREILEAHQPFRDAIFKHMHPAGEAHFISISGEPMFDERGEFCGYRGTGKDVTEHMKVEEELLRFRASMDMSGDMIVLIDPAAMRFIDVNDTACRLLGYSREELLRMGPQDVLPESREELERIYDEGMIANDSSHAGTKSRYVRKDGSTFPFESTRRRLRSGDRWIIVAISRDISNRIAAEEALQKSNERFNLAVRATSDVIWDWDLLTDELWWNDNLTEVFGYRREDIERSAKSWHDRIHPADKDEVMRGIRDLMKSGEDSWSDEYRFRRQDGNFSHIYDRGHVMRDSSGRVVRMIGAKADVSARKSAEERLTYLAQFDTLTGLPNRHLFRDRLAQAMAQARRSARPIAVLFIDLDRFKLVNDTRGHLVGDELLKEAAMRLVRSVRGGDTIGRFGSDEFGVILSDLGKPGDSSAVAHKFIEALAQPYQLGEQPAYVTASIGITLFPADGEDADALMLNADAAMYRAKEQGRNNFQYYTREMNERAMQRAQIELLLRRALEHQEFLLVYQPKVDLQSGAISGLEALLRWQHPEKRVVSPAEFIPVLEDIGLIVPVGAWVLRAACVQTKAWLDTGLHPREIAVNLSARQFQQKDLEATVRRILKDTDIDPSLVQFELTESMLMTDPEAAARTLRGLKELGVKLSVDDFGTGYSSLAYLKRFPLDTLKIDRAFIRDVTTSPDDAAITLAIISLAHSLKLKVVAEGVETREQLNFLKANGCDEMQGYYFARPLAVSDCTKALAEGHRLQA
jgi:diguanylate cyclase (GGDEF)-like protein/PAS domain S-box-containing protein